MSGKEKRFDIVVVGEINPDLILSGDVIPEFGQVEKLVDTAVMTIGSSSAIFACGAARLGMRVGFIGKVGDDLFGHFMLDALRGRGVDTAGIRVDASERTGLSVILATGSDRAILTYPGAIRSLRFDELPLEQVADARHLHLASYFIQDALRPDVARLFSYAHEEGLTTSLDTNYDPSEKWDGGLDEVLGVTDLFLPNETEARAITRAQTVEYAMEMLAKRIPTVAVKLGERGARACSRGRFAQAGIAAVDFVDAVGAGDSFDAGFVTGTLMGWKLERCLRLGTICGSLSTRSAGGTDAQATMEEAEAYL